MPGIFRRKLLSQILKDVEQGEGHLKRSLGAFDLIALGIGAIIGTGILDRKSVV